MNTLTVLAMTAAMTLAPLVGQPATAAPPPSGGTISIRPTTADGEYDAALRAFADSAAAAFATRGFTLLRDDGHAAYVAELILSRGEVGTGLARAPGGRGASVVGAGVAVPFSTGRSELVSLQRTRLEMRIRKRGDAGVVWDGTAVTVREAGTRTGTEGVVASDLVQALLRTYPAEPTTVIGVP